MVRTSTAPRVERALVAACLLVAALAVSVLQPVGPASAAAVVPTAPTLPAAIEPLPAWQGVQLCDPVSRKGPLRLKALLAKTYGSTSFGITRACSGSTGTSEHHEGRALDWMISGKAQRANAAALLSWLSAKDTAGNTYAMARRMGLMYVIWDNKMFRFYDPARGWTEYSSCLTTLSSSYDTTCHRDHVHFSFTWDGAAGKTSFWSGTAVTAPSCPTTVTPAAAPAVPKAGLEFVALPPARVLDTLAGVGVTARCRLSQDSWSGENRRIDLQVAGQGGVPATGAVAATLSIQLRGPNAPTKLYVEPAGSPSPRLRASTTAMNVNGLGAVTVPLGSGGRVSLTLSTGSTDVTVDVLGYYTEPGSTTSTFHASDPARVLDTVASQAVLAPGESRTLDLDGKAGLPADGATAVAFAATASAASASGGVTVYGGADEAPPTTLLSVYAPAGRQRTNLVIAKVAPNGTVVLRNDSTGTRHLRLDVLGWWGASDLPGGSRYVPLAPKEVIDTTQNQGVTGPLSPKRAVTATLAGVAGVPATGVTAVALQATAIRPTADTVLLTWRSGASKPATRSASPRLGSDHTVFLIAPLAAGGASFINAAGNVDLRAYVVGYWYLP